MATPNTTTVHDETIRVGLDDALAHQKLDALQAKVDRLSASLGSLSIGQGVGGASGTVPSGSAMPSSSIPSGAIVGPGSGPGVGGGSPPTTVSSGAVVASSPGSPGSAQTQQGQGGAQGPQAAQSSGATTQSGKMSLFTSDEVKGFAIENQDADDPTEKLKSDAERKREEQQKSDSWARLATIAGSSIASGSLGGASSGVTSLMAYQLGGPAGAAVAAAGAILGSGLSAQSAANQQRSALERELGFVRLSGIGDVDQISKDKSAISNSVLPRVWDEQSKTWKELDPNDATPSDIDPIATMLARARDFGIKTGEAAQMARAYTNAAGGLVVGESDFLFASTAGIDPSTMGAFDRARFLGGAGGSERSALSIAGTAQNGFGIQGGLNEWLRGIASQIDRLIERGMRVNIDDVGGLLSKMASTPSLAGLGMQAPGVVGALGDVGAGVRQKLLQPFAGLMGTAATISILSKSNDYFDAIRNAESFGPEDAIRANMEMWGKGDLSEASIAASIPMLTMRRGTHREAGGLNRMRKGEARPLRGMHPSAYERSVILADEDMNRVFNESTSPGEMRSQVGIGMSIRQIGQAFADSFNGVIKAFKAFEGFLGAGGYSGDQEDGTLESGPPQTFPGSIPGGTPGQP